MSDRRAEGKIHKFEHCHGGTDDGDGHFAEKRLNHFHLFQECVLVTKLKHNSFKPGISLVKGLLQGVI